MDFNVVLMNLLIIEKRGKMPNIKAKKRGKIMKRRLQKRGK